MFFAGILQPFWWDRVSSVLLYTICRVEWMLISYSVRANVKYIIHDYIFSCRLISRYDVAFCLHEH